MLVNDVGDGGPVVGCADTAVRGLGRFGPVRTRGASGGRSRGAAYGPFRLPVPYPSHDTGSLVLRTAPAAVAP